jgi:hypothetical protein
MKLKSFCTTKEMISKLKRLHTEWEKNLAIYTSDKELTTRIYREIKKAKHPKIQWLNEEMDKWTNKAIKEMQIKTMLRFCSHSCQNSYLQKHKNNKCWWGCREKGTLIHCWWECKLVQPLWKTVWSSSKN